MKTYNQKLKNKLDSLNNEFNKKEFFKKETIKKYINITEANESYFAYDNLKDILQSIMSEYDSKINIQYVQENTRNFKNVFNTKSDNQIILDISLNNINGIIKNIKNLKEYSNIKNKKDFIYDIKNIITDLQYRVLDNFDVEEYDSFYSDIKNLENKSNDYIDIYDLTIDYLQDNLQDNYYTFKVESKGYSQGDYDTYTFIIGGNKTIAKQFEKQITQPLQSIFTTHEVNVSINKLVKYTYFTKDNIETETETIEEEIENYGITLLGNETQKEIEKHFKEYKDYVIYFNN